MTNALNDTLLLCPVCKEKLIKDVSNKIYKCINNHTYDIAKEGYVNLLISNQKRSKNPGDSKDMVLARIDFLSRGYYKPLCDKINEIIYEHLKDYDNGKYNILDLGCGEGYYLTSLKDYIDNKDVQANYYGMDVSKDAVKYAGKANKDCTWFVGNNFHIPAGDKSIDCILSVFSPIDIDECNRVLKDNGIFVRVLPRTDHLIQLRNIIYSEVHLNDKVYKASVDENEYIKESNVTFDIMLNKEEIVSLLKMTPHYWKTTQENKEKLDAYDSLTITIDMRIGVFKKK
ncbi:23S rRNA (guanine(745)-N(1))-methyltransferase [Clostridium saccharobutylicum]|uniref:putative RNA methyltransferase n=1 Tax=Clostridium saccharobutylicum TaxID=169679 RepID=UPI000983F399|nr:methyltransferase domain-containing protein [Clostridium saccharobutylicum]AQS09113.1 23S rRNA (guanine(745)-N(1))-methyltransferase [Clostridium saccharobutylicum]MBC2435384.1 methyltransferase domain-containing protein [Clostridium saccharobutylicum]NSB87349.1 23S rRNA (guanine745-N1)-methyltransferase [Clostridium saccharobutylicum]NYC28526.1 23S rRNA (guanine745-N1)-methyltransferase [Clostridium saccharobutylicum]OOM15717.1 23S rRNA (guanine(745)-N(1))-methyltransferase [Clostridium sa